METQAVMSSLTVYIEVLNAYVLVLRDSDMNNKGLNHGLNNSFLTPETVCPLQARNFFWKVLVFTKHNIHD